MKNISLRFSCGFLTVFLRFPWLPGADTAATIKSMVVQGLHRMAVVSASAEALLPKPPECWPRQSSGRHAWQLLGHICPRKNSESHIAASHSRQPLVKGERLVRYEVNAVMGMAKATALSVTLSGGALFAS